MAAESASDTPRRDTLWLEALRAPKCGGGVEGVWRGCVEEGGGWGLVLPHYLEPATLSRTRAPLSPTSTST